MIAKIVPLSTNIPKRKTKQQNVLQLTSMPISQLNVGIIGLGKRGMLAIERWCNIPNTAIVAICDTNSANIYAASNKIKHYRKQQPVLYHGEKAFKQMCQQTDVHLIYICTDWMSHTPIAIEAMQMGKHVAIEVPAALSLKDIWRLIDTAEQTRCHCMMLENTIYDQFEWAVANMVQAGLFGEIVHVEGGYAHPLGVKWEPWRIELNKDLRGDLYPTHGLGPLCKILNIHRTDTLDYLVAMDTASFMGKKQYQKITNKLCAHFSNGDQTTTILRTKQGRTITLQHNVMTQRPYSRMFQIVGTHGYASKYPIYQICLNHHTAQKLGFTTQDEWGVLTQKDTLKLIQQYQLSYSPSITTTAQQLDTHGGMSYYMDYRLSQALLHGTPLDMDVYDLAEWCAVSELSRLSIENNSAPIAFPNFIRQ